MTIGAGTIGSGVFGQPVTSSQPTINTFGSGTFGSGTFGAPTAAGRVTRVDAAGAADSVRLLRRRTVTDPAGATDTAGRSAVRGRGFSDRGGGSDTATVMGDGRFRFADRSRVTDALTLRLVPQRPRGSVFGDAEAAVVALLRDGADLDAVPVSTDLIGYRGGTWVRVVRTGGMPTLWRRLDNPALTITVYADDQGSALDLAWHARAAIHAARGRYVGHGLAVCDVLDAEGVTWSPDELNPQAARYTFRVVLVTKPTAVS